MRRNLSYGIVVGQTLKLSSKFPACHGPDVGGTPKASRFFDIPHQIVSALRAPKYTGEIA